LRERLRIAALFGSDASQPGLDVGGKMYFHRLQAMGYGGCCQRVPGTSANRSFTVTTRFIWRLPDCVRFSP
jgi:hypothetical protein